MAQRVEHLPHKQKVLGLNPQSPCEARYNTRFLQLQSCYRTKGRDRRNPRSLQARDIDSGIDRGKQEALFQMKEKVRTHRQGFL